MNIFKYPRKGMLVVSAICALAASITHHASAALICYEGFDYPLDTSIDTTSSLNGGSGWLGAWSTDVYGNLSTAAGHIDVITNGLTYTDGNGKNLQVVGNAARNTGLGGTSRPWRQMNTIVGANGTTTWISFVGVRIGELSSSNSVDRGANLTLYWTNYMFNTAITNDAGAASGTDNNGRVAFGESSGVRADYLNDTWSLIPNGNGTERRVSTEPFTNKAFYVCRITHYNDNDLFTASTNDWDTYYAWVNPVLGSTPCDSTAFTNVLHDDFSGTGNFGWDVEFNVFAFFAGAAQTDRPATDWIIDEIRVGDTYADVAPCVDCAAPVQPGISGIQVSGNNVSLTVTGAANTVYSIIASTNVATVTNVLGMASSTDCTGQGGTYTDTGALTGQSQRFYRAKQ